MPINKSCKIKAAIFILLLLPVSSMVCFAQAPTFDQDVVDAPLDDGLFLLIGVAIYFIYRFQQFRKHNLNKVAISKSKSSSF